MTQAQTAETSEPVTTEDVRDTFMDSCPVRPLGHRNGLYYFLSPVGELRTLKPSDFTLTGLISLFEGNVQWLEKNFERTDRKGRSIDGYIVTDAAAALVMACRNQGLFDSGIPIRGPGVWRSGSNEEAIAEIIVHCGDILLVKGQWQDAGARIGNAIYPAAPRIQRIAEKPSTPAEGEFLRELISNWNFRRPEMDTDLILGFIAQAMLGGAPRWRAHMMVTGEKGTGKSLLADVVATALGGGAHPVTNNFTEAGLRQALTGEARCLVLDETEQEDGNGGRVAKVIELLRHMSGGDGAKVLRGASGGQAQSFAVTGCAYLSSILHVPLKPQDKSRITSIKLNPLATVESSSITVIEEKIKKVRKMSPALRRRMIDGWPRYLAFFDSYRAAFMATNLVPRSADQLAALYAGKETLLHDGLPTRDGIDIDVDNAATILADLREDEKDGEGHQCLSHLYSAHTENMRNGNRMTVGQVLMEGMDNNDNKMIGAYGFRIEVIENNKYLVIATNSVGLNRIFYGTRWQGGAWIQAIEMIKGKTTGKTHRFGGAPSRGYIVPEQYWPKDKEDDE